MNFFGLAGSWNMKRHLSIRFKNEAKIAVTRITLFELLDCVFDDNVN